MLFEAVNVAFREDRVVLEAQHRNIKERPDGNLVNIVHDAGPNMLIRLLDKLIAEEAAEREAPRLSEVSSLRR
jgi:hypothetical protein